MKPAEMRELREPFPPRRNMQTWRACGRVGRRFNKDWVEYVSRLDDNELEEEVDYRTMSCGPSKSPRWQMMQHVVNHSTYHRRQVTTVLRQLGARGVSTDLISYYRERSAAAKA